MRIAVIALAASLAGCSVSPGNGSECTSDSQCGDDVCARSGECTTRSTVRSVTVRWTVNGAPAETACAARPDLYVQFDGADYGDTLRFAPVSCREGSFFVDKVPKRYQQVELGFEGGTGDISSVDLTAPQAPQVQFDLFQ